MKKQFYLLRRQICRWIMGFDTCPTCYKKNFRPVFLQALGYIAVSFGMLVFFAWLFLTF